MGIAGRCLHRFRHHAVILLCKYIFGSDTLYSSLYFAEQVIGMVVILACPFLTKYLAKNKLIILGSLVVIAGEVILLTDPHNFYLLIISCVMRAVGLPRHCIGGSLFI